MSDSSIVLKRFAGNMPPAYPNPLEGAFPWPFLPVLVRMSMAVAVGIFIGLEREHKQKTGVRTFALAALLGCLGGLMSLLFAGLALLFIAMIIVGMNYKEITRNQKLVITTSVALAVVGFAGVLFGQGHVFTPAVAGILTAALLAWKRPISHFALGLSDQELRSAILLAILTFIIMPILPSHPVDPWGLIEPRSNWVSVIIIAGIGFVNYILMKAFGARGMEITAFFGGLVNSRKVIVELTTRLRDLGTTLLPAAQRGILLATGAMLLRNGLILAVLAPMAVVECALPLLAMSLVNVAFWWKVHQKNGPNSNGGSLVIESPFRLSAAFKFGLVFLLLNVAGVLAQRMFGSNSFYFISIAGGLLSSASSIASAATLIARHDLTLMTGASGIILSTITSVVTNIPLIRGLTKDEVLKREMTSKLSVIGVVGVVVGLINHFFFVLTR